MSEYKDSILVLRTYKLAESDRILSCLAKQHGKIRVVAKGARKPKSKFGGRVEPFTELNASLWKGRGELDTLRQVDVISLNGSLHQDLDKMMKAATVVEMVDKVSFDGQELPELFTLATRALRSLARTDSPNFLAVFALRLLVLEGLAPQLDGCRVCGDPNLVSIEARHGYGLCITHAVSPTISPRIVELMRTVLAGRTASVLNLGTKEDSSEFEKVVMEYLEHVLSLKLFSLHANDL